MLARVVMDEQESMQTSQLANAVRETALLILDTVVDKYKIRIDRPISVEEAEQLLSLVDQYDAPSSHEVFDSIGTDLFEHAHSLLMIELKARIKQSKGAEINNLGEIYVDIDA